MDSDDAFYPQMIQVMVNAIGRSNADIVECGYEVYDALLDRSKIQEVHRYNEEIFCSTEALNRLILGKLSQCVWNKMYKASLWKGIQFPEGYVYEDVRTTYRVLEKSDTVQTLPDLLYKYRKWPSSITNKDSEKNAQDWLFAYHDLEEFVCTNTPSIFSEYNRNQFLDVTLRREELFCAEAMADPAHHNSFWINRRNSILTERRTKCQPQSVKSLLAHWTFLLCPRYTPPIRKAFRFCKRIVKSLHENRG